MRIVVLVAALTAPLFAPACTGTTRGAWCAVYTGDNVSPDCNYRTQQQCLDTVRGVGGVCEPNPRLARRNPV